MLTSLARVAPAMSGSVKLRSAPCGACHLRAEVGDLRLASRPRPEAARLAEVASKARHAFMVIDGAHPERPLTGRQQRARQAVSTDEQANASSRPAASLRKLPCRPPARRADRQGHPCPSDPKDRKMQSARWLLAASGYAEVIAATMQ